MWLIFLLILSPILFFLLLSLILLPFHFTFYSLINIITTPFQLAKIALNKRLRNNHALEHATINILEKRYGYNRLSGFARENGFVIQGRINPEHLQEAAMLGLYQLQGGNKELAIHQNCGTSILAANFSSAVIFLLLLWFTGTFNILNVLLAIILSQFVGPRAGKIFQKYITTSTDVKDIAITGVLYNQPRGAGVMNFPFLGGNEPGQYFVKTQRY
ncbi:DUF6391 domain-containing protein [Natranaerofaba carboxydovora]|uniref:DUF6391 domain-containing protein n=1 Tax=Natranaerofaba carboxydovora TaxID=2742683 RepID=UPI001F1350D9|nr:DUF6391 domain-containing protein [Natranaerofaba carboxydovora]UMZ74875.1 hypothetical protein ACONDI_02479 [Natranaerofaba carboxydovora]